MFGHSDHAWLWTLKRTELLLNYSYHLWSSQILYLHTPQDTINLSYKKFRIWKIYLMRVPYCETLILLSCKLLFTSIQSTTKYIVFFKMPSYDFSISSCSLNIFSQETEKNCMIFFMKKDTYQENFPRSTTFYVQKNSYGHSMELTSTQSQHWCFVHFEYT